MIPGDFPNKTVYDSMHFHRHFMMHDITKEIAHPEILTWNGIFWTIMLCANIYVTIKNIYLQIHSKSSYFKKTNFV